MDEKWTEPEVALLDRRGKWMLVGSEGPLCFDPAILEVVSPPALRLSEGDIAAAMCELAFPERGKEL